MKTRYNLLYIFIIIVFFFGCRKHHLNNDFCDCASTSTTKIIDTTTILIPNIFTPNSDGHNDYWQIENIDRYPDCTVKVTRPGLLGGVVFESTGYAQMWGGDNNGSTLKKGKYKYEITIGQEKIEGFVCILNNKKVEYSVYSPDYDCIGDCIGTDMTDPLLGH